MLNVFGLHNYQREIDNFSSITRFTIKSEKIRSFMQTPRSIRCKRKKNGLYCQANILYIHNLIQCKTKQKRKKKHSTNPSYFTLLMIIAAPTFQNVTTINLKRTNSPDIKIKKPTKKCGKKSYVKRKEKDFYSCCCCYYCTLKSETRDAD